MRPVLGDGELEVRQALSSVVTTASPQLWFCLFRPGDLCAVLSDHSRDEDETRGKWNTLSKKPKEENKPGG